MSPAHRDNPVTPCSRIITAILEEIIERLIDGKALVVAEEVIVVVIVDVRVWISGFRIIVEEIQA